MQDNLQIYLMGFQLVIFALQGLLFLATRREKQETQSLIKEGLRQALRVIVTRSRG